MGRYLALQKPVNDHHLNQVCWSRETSQTCRTGGPEDQGWEPLFYIYCFPRLAKANRSSIKPTCMCTHYLWCPLNTSLHVPFSPQPQVHPLLLSQSAIPSMRPTCVFLLTPLAGSAWPVTLSPYFFPWVNIDPKIKSNPTTGLQLRAFPAVTHGNFSSHFLGCHVLWFLEP